MIKPQHIRDPVIGLLVYNNAQETYLACWDCGDPLLVHVELVTLGKLFFHVVQSEITRWVPTSWIKWVKPVTIEEAGDYSCLTPPWVQVEE